jgi:chaperonin GroEL (HSP60 family)
MSQKEKEALENQAKELRRVNALVVRAFAESLKSSLGPQGLDKMVIDPYLNVTITNDGSTWLRYLDVRHPTAKILVDAARTMYKEVGDGTTSMIVLASELIWRATDLTRKGVAPATIQDGYSAAMNRALKVYSDMAMRIDPMDARKLKGVALTAIAGKSMFQDEDRLAGFAVEAVLAAAYKASSGYMVDLEDIGIEKKHGGSHNDSMLVKGLAIAEREVAHSSMPKMIKDARIAILNRPIAIELKPKDVDSGKWTKTEMKFRVDSVEKLRSSMVQQERLFEGWVEKIANCGTNVVVCRRHIDDLAKFLLGRRSILAVEHVRQPEIFKLAKASGGQIVEDLDEITASDLGSADTVQERDMGPPRPWIFIEGCKNPRSYTIVIRGGTKTGVEASEKCVRNALSAVRNAVINPKILPGGGAPEVEAARRIRTWAERHLPGQEQLPATVFADALEEIPSALAKNAGMDPIDTLVRLRSHHARGASSAGIDGFTQEIDNTATRSIYDTLTVREQMIKSASELALTIVRIDMILASTKPRTDEHRERRAGMELLTKQGRES